MDQQWIGLRPLSRVSIASTLYFSRISPTYPNDVAVTFMELVKLDELLMSLTYHRGDIEIRRTCQEWTRKSLQPMESNSIDDHAEKDPQHRASDEVGRSPERR